MKFCTCLDSDKKILIARCVKCWEKEKLAIEESGRELDGVGTWFPEGTERLKDVLHKGGTIMLWERKE